MDRLPMIHFNTTLETVKADDLKAHEKNMREVWDADLDPIPFPSWWTMKTSENELRIFKMVLADNE